MLKRLFLIIITLSCNLLTNCHWWKALQHKKPLSCHELYKQIAGKALSQKQRDRIKKQGIKCLETKKDINFKVLILESVLQAAQRQNASVTEMKYWEKMLAELSFSSLKNYEKSLKYYTRLLRRPLGLGEKFFIQYRIAESFFHLQNYSQALREIEKCFFTGVSRKQEKQAGLLKARTLIAHKQNEKALLFLETQIEKFKEEEKFLREYRALIYEQQKDFASAIKELEKIHPSTPFIEQKIQNLAHKENQTRGGVQ